ncbi:hypothetical protein F8388_018827 [Cannabis sativa]|uniref:DUF4283 domain-containing protein n=1 Tax=Cannabis sativa TaxID=3483 RepID=A0A7J6F918_CANSA|nr:hypothetical protein F8388_018827 [Cannabis sativa]KAF4403571.1 hypothetical protein G4B88_002424 [Cannabis sativa]
MLQTPELTMENLLDRTNNLRVEDEDGWEINEAKETEVGNSCLMGRFCSNKTLNKTLIRTILGRVWGLAEVDWGVKIKRAKTEATFMIFSFKNKNDLTRIVNKSPWLLNNGILILQRLSKIPSKWEGELTRFPLSGRVLNLPTRSITRSNMIRLGSMAGEVIEIQKEDVTKIALNGFFWFKVWISIDKPLCPGWVMIIDHVPRTLRKSLMERERKANEATMNKGIKQRQSLGEGLEGDGQSKLSQEAVIDLLNVKDGNSFSDKQGLNLVPRITNKNSTIMEVPVSISSLPSVCFNLMDKIDDKRIERDFVGEGSLGVKRRDEPWELHNSEEEIKMKTGKRV